MARKQVPRRPKMGRKNVLTCDIAKSSKNAPLCSENLTFEVSGAVVEQPFRVEIATKFDVMLDHVSDHDFDRFLMDFGSNLGRHTGPKTGPRRVR